MKEEIKQRIRSLLNEGTFVARANHIKPKNYSSLIDCILQLELMQEIAVLRNFLKEPQTFNEQFIQRCAWRTHPNNSITFTDVPASITNRMYWKIALILFEPKTMREMFPIVIPHINTHMKIALPTALPDGLRSTWGESLVPTIVSSNVNEFTGPPKLEDFTHYVFADDQVMNAVDISNFSLRLHARVYHSLDINHPTLAQNLYTHNTCLNMLAGDILTLTNKGLTPKHALEQLIRQLTLGGNRMTGYHFASKSTIDAVGQFSEYFYSLPQPTQNDLKALEGDKTLGSIIDEDLAEGHCVESAAYDLTLVLENNKKNPILTVLPHMLKEDFNKLERKYRSHLHSNSILNTRKGFLVLKQLPEHLTRGVLSKLSPINLEELIIIFLNFPTELYVALCQNITFNNPYATLGALTSHIDLFNLEQRVALAKAIIKNYQRFNPPLPLIYWALNTNDPIFIQEALNSIAEYDRLNIIKIADVSGNAIVHDAANEVLGALIEPLPQSHRLEALSLANREGNTVLHLKADHSQILLMLLSLLLEEQRFSVVTLFNKKGQSVLHFAALTPESLIAILKLLPKYQRLDALNLVNKNKVTVLQIAARKPGFIHTILILLPEEHRLKAILGLDDSQYPALYYSFNNLECIKPILHVLPETDRLFFLRMTYNGQSVLSKIVEKQIFINYVIEGYVDSFLPTFLNLWFFLTVLCKTPRFFQSEEAEQIVMRINELNSFDEIKVFLNDYIRNTSTPFCNALKYIVKVELLQPESNATFCAS